MTSYRFGTVSNATMRPEDLIPAFLDELRSKRPLTRSHRKIASDIHRRMQKRGYWDSEDVGYDLENLFDLLDVYAAPYFYFGAHPGDGSDYGYWLAEDWEENFDGIKIGDLADLPSRYVGEVLVVNDHGNMTLYNRSRNGRIREIWGIV